MSYPQPSGYPQQQQVIYRADPQMAQSLRAIRDRLQGICRQHANRWVRVETLDGHVHIGRIMHCDRGLLYLSVPQHGAQPGQPYGPQRGFPGGLFYNQQILTLVLYELLVITLLYT